MKKEDWGLGLGLDDFFRLRTSFCYYRRPRELIISMGESPRYDSGTTVY